MSFFFFLMCCVKLVYSEAILVNYPNSVKLEFLQGDARFIWNLFTNLLGGEAVVFRTLVLLKWQLLCCDLCCSPLRQSPMQSHGFFFFWILMIVGTCYAIYLNWTMVPDKVIGMKLVYHPLWCVINRKCSNSWKKRKQIRFGWLI